MSIILIAVLAAMLNAIIRKDSPSIAIALTLAAGTVILFFGLDYMGQILNTLSGFMAAAGIEGNTYLPVIKAVGIACVVRVSSELCRDAGESGLAAKLELCGTGAAIWVTLPLFQDVLELISGLFS